MSDIAAESDRLFSQLDRDLFGEFGNDKESQEYFKDPRDFRSLRQVINILKDVQGMDEIDMEDKDELNQAFTESPAYVNLQDRLKLVSDIIEEVVTFQHGGLNYSVDTMSEVLKAYTSGRRDIKGLKEALKQTKNVLMSQKTGIKQLWLQKTELDESIRILKNIEFIKDAPGLIKDFITKKRYLSGVLYLNKSIDIVFSEDMISVEGISLIREHIFELKEALLEHIVAELRRAIHGYAVQMNSIASQETREEDAEGEANERTRNRRVDSNDISGLVEMDDIYAVGDDDSDDEDDEDEADFDGSIMCSSAIGARTIRSRVPGINRAGGSVISGLSRRGARLRSVSAASDISTDANNFYAYPSIWGTLGSTRTQDEVGEHFDAVTNGQPGGANTSTGRSHAGLVLLSHNLCAELSNPVDYDSILEEEAVSELAVHEILSRVRDGVSPLFLQLLVRAVRYLRSVDDVERLLLDDGGRCSSGVDGAAPVQAPALFQQLVQTRRSSIRRRLQRLSTRLQRLKESNSSSFVVGVGNGTGAAEYSGGEAGGGRVAAVGMDEENFGEGNREEPSQETLQAILFTEYVVGLFHVSFATLRRLLYVLGLLSHTTSAASFTFSLPSQMFDRDGTGQLSSSGGSGSHALKKMKIPNRAAVLLWWKGVEGLVRLEIESHLRDKGVEAISDAGLRPSLSATLLKELGRDGAHAHSSMDGADTDAFVEDDIEARPGMVTSLINRVDDNGPVFTPSTKLAAPIYRQTCKFSENVIRLLREEGVVDADAICGADSSNKTRYSSTSLSTPASHMKSKTILQQAEYVKNIPASDDKAAVSQVFSLVDDTVENALLPVVLSLVNAEARDLRSDPANFSVSAFSAVASSSVNAPQRSGSYSDSNDIVNKQQPQPLPNSFHGVCRASQSCLRTARPLFMYWNQLTKPHHRDMVLTIFQRLVSGFTASAREELDSATWGLLTGPVSALPASHSTAGCRRDIAAALSMDPLFLDYRRKILDGKVSVDQAIAQRLGAARSVSALFRSDVCSLNSEAEPTASVRSFQASSSDMRSDFAGATASAAGEERDRREEHAYAQEFRNWGAKWELGRDLSLYPLSRSMVAMDTSIIGTAAAISHGCDWLAARLIKTCNWAVRRSIEEYSSSAHPARKARYDASLASVRRDNVDVIGTAAKSSRNSSGVTTVALKALRKEQGSLWKAVLETVRPLTSLGEEAMAVIRAELQLSCFLHLHALAHLRLRPLNQHAQGPAAFSSIVPGASRQSVAMTSASGSGVNMIAAVERDIDGATGDLQLHLRRMCSVAAQALTAEARAAALVPTLSLIPRLVLRCMHNLVSTGSLLPTDPVQAQLSSSSVPGVASSAAVRGGLMPQPEAKATQRRLLTRLLAAAHSVCTAALDNARLDPITLTRLTDETSDTFEHVQRFVALLDTPLNQLPSCIRNGREEFTQQDLLCIWNFVRATSTESATDSLRVSFEDCWGGGGGVDRAVRPNPAVPFNRSGSEKTR